LRIVTDLKPCPRSPNCVSTRSADPAHRIDPISFAGPLAEARERLLGVLRGMPGATVVRAEERYLAVEFRTAVLRFVDDVELVLDPGEGLIHFRSASRKGYWDLGVNRRRMELVRRKYEEAAQRAAGGGGGRP
jgi:uncharacterized protein (DUF1499 family)